MLRSVRRLLPALLLLASLSARAADTVPDLAQSGPAEYKSEGTAYALALGGTMATVMGGIWLMNHDQGTLGVSSLAFGVLAAPSLGQFYAGSPGQGSAGIGIRGAGSLLFLAGLAEALDDWGCGGSWFGGETENCEDSNDGAGLMLLGTVVLGAGGAYSLVDTHLAIERHRKRHGLAVGLSPTFALAQGGGIRPGARAWLRF